MVRAPYMDKNGVRKGAWSVDEDTKLKACIERYGHWNWRELPRLAGLSRCGKSCRLRWLNYLRPDVRRGSYSEEEESLIIRLHTIHGNKWSTIASNLPGRTDNEIKNHWHTHLKKRFQPGSAAAERSQESETDQIYSDRSGSRSETLTVHCSSSSSSSFSSSPSSSMYQILESSSISAADASCPTTSMAEDSLFSLAEDILTEEFVADIFRNFGDLFNLPISECEFRVNG